MNPTIATSHAAPRTRRQARRMDARRGSFLQKLAAALLLLGVAALFASLDWSRRLEASIAEWSIGAVLRVGSDLAPEGTRLTVGAGSHTIFTLDVSIACSVVLLLTPLLLVAAALLVTGRASLLRTLPAVVFGALMLLAINAARFVLIASMTLNDGLAGYGWAHTVYGSIIALVGLAIVLVGFIRIVAGGAQARKGARS